MTLLSRNQIIGEKGTLIASISAVKEFEIPTKFLSEKNRPKALVMWYYHCLREVRKLTEIPFIAQMKPAKQLIEKYGWEESALAIRRAIGGKYTPSLWWIKGNPKSNLVGLE
ncbi:MAG: hypothetical protein H8D67_30900 [Deltaproteobacteria bacterium]|nr:hypothetical protein [Deltaproteobacteria bacterium]